MCFLADPYTEKKTTAAMETGHPSKEELARGYFDVIVRVPYHAGPMVLADSRDTLYTYII